MTRELDNEIRLAIQKISLSLIKKESLLLYKLRSRLYYDLKSNNTEASIALNTWRLLDDTSKIKS